MEKVTRAALLIIDMEKGFLEPESAQCIQMAKDTLPACAKAAAKARELGVPVFFVRRVYREDGSDVESTRYESWVFGGKAMSSSCSENISDGYHELLKPQPGDYEIIKPRFSAFFMTELDLMLRRLRIDTILLAGTTTPNCIRTTCYDGISLEYNVIILEDCCSSQTRQIQEANISDMANIGARISSSQEFVQKGLDNYDNLVKMVQGNVLDFCNIQKQ